MHLFKSEMLHEVPVCTPRSYRAPAFGRRYGRRASTAVAMPEVALDRLLALRVEAVNRSAASESHSDVITPGLDRAA